MKSWWHSMTDHFGERLSMSWHRYVDWRTDRLITLRRIRWLESDQWLNEDCLRSSSSRLWSFALKLSSDVNEILYQFMRNTFKVMIATQVMAKWDKPWDEVYNVLTPSGNITLRAVPTNIPDPKTLKSRSLSYKCPNHGLETMLKTIISSRYWMSISRPNGLMVWWQDILANGIPHVMICGGILNGV